MSGARRLGDSVRQRLSFLAGQQPADLVLAGQKLGADEFQSIGALLRRGRRPSRLCCLGGCYGGFGLCLVGLGIFANDLGDVRRVDILADTFALEPFAIDEIAMQRHDKILPNRSKCPKRPLPQAGEERGPSEAWDW